MKITLSIQDVGELLFAHSRQLFPSMINYSVDNVDVDGYGSSQVFVLTLKKEQPTTETTDAPSTHSPD